MIRTSVFTRKFSRIAVCVGSLAIALTTTSLAATEGRTPGTFAVSATGAATYSIPIFAPHGPRGIQPHISLVYNSQSGIGPLGVGWSIGGLSSIVRCNKTIAQDSVASAVTFAANKAANDGYCLDGKKLRLTSASGTYGAAGSTYQTEVADFSNITANGQQNYGPASFTVKAKNGLTYYYGFTDANGNGAGSQVLYLGPRLLKASVGQWLLSKVVDPSGNNYVINYTTLTNVAVPSEILWTATSSTAYAYTMTFNYPSPGNVPQSSIYAYVGSASLVNTDLLQSITISYSGTVVKNYVLGYSTSSTTSRKTLASVKECADAAGTNCLLPTAISYQHGMAGVSTGNPQSPLSGVTGTVLTHYDLNGDGYPDLVYVSAGVVYVAWGSANGYSTSQVTNTNIAAANLGPVGDLFGSGQDGILYNASNTWYYLYWNGTKFAGLPTGVSYTGPNTMLADVDGDGKPDLVTWTVTSNSLSLSSALNQSSAGTISFASGSGGGGVGCGNQSATCTFTVWTPDTAGPGSLRSWDFNGDGTNDFLVSETDANGGNELYYVLTSATYIQMTIAFQNFGLTTPFVGDFNGDGCDDIVFNGAIQFSGCDGSTPIASYGISGTPVAVMDWDGDGRPDVLVANGSSLEVELSTGTGVGSAQSTSLSYTSGCFVADFNGDGLDDFGCSGGGLTYYLHNGAGTPPDLMNSIQDGYGNSASPTYVSIAQSNYTKYSDATYPDSNFVGPMYVVSEVVFSDPSALSSTYNQTFWYYGAWVNLQGRGFDSFYGKRIIDSRNGLYYYNYYERGFPFTGMDFNDVLSNNDGAHIVVSNRTPNTPASATISDTTNEQRYFPYFTNVTTTQDELGGPDDGLPITTTSTNYSYDGYGNALTIDTTVTDNDPGAWDTTYSGKSWTINVTNTPDVDTTHWCLTLLSETQTAYSASIGGSVTRTKSFSPDTTNCRYNQIVTEPTSNSGAYAVTEGLTYDSFGNIATDTVTGANMPSSPASRETQMNWGPTGQFLNSIKVPIGTLANATPTATTSWGYTSNQALTFGVPDSVKDANALTTSWAYDAFGRKISEVRPNNTATNWSLTACTTNCWNNSVYQVSQTQYESDHSTVIRIDTNYYDPIDRIIQSAGPNLTNTTVTVQKLYNSLGLLAQQSLPFLSGGTAYQQTYFYDALNRLLETARPITSTSGPTVCATLPLATGCQGVSYAYAGRKRTVTDAKGNTNTIITDVNGWLRKTTDAVGTGYAITRAYDAAGSLTGVTDSVGNTLLSGVNVVYGIKPFVTAAVDADRGGWLFTTDSLGERIAWTDANGKSFSMSYDAQSRPSTRTEPDLFSEWNYGTVVPSVGLLTSECTASALTTNLCNATGSSWLYSEIRAYDGLARLSTRSITQTGNTGGNDGGGAFLYTYKYAPPSGPWTGQLYSLTYPTSTSGNALNLQYAYAYGLLLTVTDTSDTPSTCGTTCVLWKADTTNAFGQVTQETLGNGVITNRSYDRVTSWLTGATAGVGGGAGLLNQSYLQDENGNVIQRQAVVQGTSLTENFYYDADNRLCASVLNGTGGCTTPTIIYDYGNPGPGNITTQTAVGTYTYPAAGQPRPHAVSSISGTYNGSFSYDANGNMTARESSSPNIVWSSYNYPISISASDVTGSEEVQFNYGPDRQRWKQTYTGPSGTEQTYYVGNGVFPAPAQLEVVFNGTTTNYRHYIYAGSEPVAVYSRTIAGVNTMSYTLEDHQGGVSAILSNSAGVTTDQSFSAFGDMRNAQTWSGTPTSLQLNSLSAVTRQGYTFQTWLGQSMGLNHMNGRVEDAILGRMLSPDRHVPDPTNAQSYNRYSYANNNPLSNIDPTGFVSHKCLDGCSSPSPDPVGGGVDGNPSVFTADGATGAMDLAAADAMGLSNSQLQTAITTGLTIGGSVNPIAAFQQWVDAAGGSAQSQVTPNNSGVSISWVWSPVVTNVQGGFLGVADFNVPTDASGVIIQQVSFGADGAAAGGTYWEGWTVTNGSVDQQDAMGGNDRFMAPSASYSPVTGLVQFYPGATMANFPELVPNGPLSPAAPPSGDLSSSYSQPANWTSAGALPHQIVVTPAPSPVPAPGGYYITSTP